MQHIVVDSWLLRSIIPSPSIKLRAENSRIDAFDEDLKNTAQEMLLVMYAADGIGLAAPQVRSLHAME